MKKKRFGITKKDLESGSKRVNMTLTIREFEELCLCAEYQKIEYTSLSHSWVVQRSRDESAKIRKSGYVPESQRGESFLDLLIEPKVKGRNRR